MSPFLAGSVMVSAAMTVTALSITRATAAMIFCILLLLFFLGLLLLKCDRKYHWAYAPAIDIYSNSTRCRVRERVKTSRQNSGGSTRSNDGVTRWSGILKEPRRRQHRALPSTGRG